MNLSSQTHQGPTQHILTDPEADKRGKVARRLNATYQKLITQLGGSDGLDASVLMTVQNVACLQMRFEAMMLDMVNGEKVSDTTMNSIHRSIQLGLSELGLAGPESANGKTEPTITIESVLAADGRSPPARKRLLEDDDDEEGREGWSDDEVDGDD